MKLLVTLTNRGQLRCSQESQSGLATKKCEADALTPADQGGIADRLLDEESFCVGAVCADGVERTQDTELSEVGAMQLLAFYTGIFRDCMQERLQDLESANQKPDYDRE